MVFGTLLNLFKPQFPLSSNRDKRNPVFLGTWRGLDGAVNMQATAWIWHVSVSPSRTILPLQKHIQYEFVLYVEILKKITSEQYDVCNH